MNTKCDVCRMKGVVGFTVPVLSRVFCDGTAWPIPGTYSFTGIATDEWEVKGGKLSRHIVNVEPAIPGSGGHDIWLVCRCGDGNSGKSLASELFGRHENDEQIVEPVGKGWPGHASRRR